MYTKLKWSVSSSFHRVTLMISTDAKLIFVSCQTSGSALIFSFEKIPRSQFALRHLLTLLAYQVKANKEPDVVEDCLLLSASPLASGIRVWFLKNSWIRAISSGSKNGACGEGLCSSGVSCIRVHEAARLTSTILEVNWLSCSRWLLDLFFLLIMTEFLFSIQIFTWQQVEPYGSLHTPLLLLPHFRGNQKKLL